MHMLSMLNAWSKRMYSKRLSPNAAYRRVKIPPRVDDHSDGDTPRSIALDIEK